MQHKILKGLVPWIWFVVFLLLAYMCVTAIFSIGNAGYMATTVGIFILGICQSVAIMLVVIYVAPKYAKAIASFLVLLSILFVGYFALNKYLGLITNPLVLGQGIAWFIGLSVTYLCYFIKK